MDGDAPSCSTSPSKSNFQVSQAANFHRNQTESAGLLDNLIVPHSKVDVQVKPELPNPKAPDRLKYRGSAADHLDATSSVSSYCLDAGGLQQNFSMNGLDDVQSHSRSSIPFTATIDGLAPDALLSRDYDSGKDIQNFLPNYNGSSPSNIPTDFSSGINSQSFEVPTMPFKPGSSNDGAMNEMGVLNGGLWPNQTQRMRTYTKVDTYTSKQLNVSLSICCSASILIPIILC